MTCHERARFGNNAKLLPAMPSEFLQDCSVYEWRIPVNREKTLPQAK